MIKIKISQIGLRKPAPKDIKGIAEVFKKQWPSQKNASFGYLQKLILEEMKAGHRYIIAKDKNKVVGFVSWRTWGEPRHQLVELYHIGVLREYSGQGIGSQLVEHLIKRANEHYQNFGYEGIRKLFLLNHAQNIGAQKFYQQLGFKKIARLPDFFRPGVDELVFTKDFR